MKKALENLVLEDLNEDQKELAEVIGIESYRELVDRFGGTQLYIPQLETIERQMRNQQIRDEFNGANYDDLAIKYGLTSVAIRTIVKDISCRIKAGVSKDQISMFDLLEN